MPATNQGSQSRWDNWPPTQMHLRPNLEHDDAEIDEFHLAINEDPIHYFLTPEGSSYEDDLDMLDFDAGIEDSKHPAPLIRSVSPSSLGGLRLPPRPPTPPKSPSTPDLDVDMMPTPDDDEQYIRFARSLGQGSDFPFHGRGYATSKANTTDRLAPPMPYHMASSATGGRAVTRPGPRPLISAGPMSGSRSMSTPRQLHHSWREPSPDVWSIEEEMEDEGRTRGGESVVQEGRRGKMVRAKTIDVPAAKPKKRVRFVLPAREVGE